MLGWFKKKFGKKKKETVEETTPQEVVDSHDNTQEDADSTTLLAAKSPEIAEQAESPKQTTQSTEDTPAIQQAHKIDSTLEPEQPQIEETTAEVLQAVPIEEVEIAPEKPEAIAESESLVSNDAILTDEQVSHISTETENIDDIGTTEQSALQEEVKENVTVDIITEDAESTIEPKETEEATSIEPPKRLKEKTKPSFFSRLSAKLAKSKEAFTYQLDTLFLGKKTIDAELLDDLEEILITADLGYTITEEVLDHARRKVKRNELSDPAALKDILKEKLASYIEDAQEDAELVMPEEGPFIIMVVGVNGVGKTTTIGKVAHKFVQSGQSVLLIAADTFRAAAVSQLQIWGERNGVDVFSQKEGADPSSVAFDGIAEAVKKDYDVVIIDTAGRLHTQANLMEELKKIKRVVAKKHEGAPHEVMLVIDATTGQNGISQAKLFNEAVNITGITLTKLDGTAKGGIVTNISKELQTPIRFIGVGEGIEDLRDFDHREFIDALFEKDK